MGKGYQQKGEIAVDLGKMSSRAASQLLSDFHKEEGTRVFRFTVESGKKYEIVAMDKSGARQRLQSIIASEMKAELNPSTSSSFNMDDLMKINLPESRR